MNAHHAFSSDLLRSAYLDALTALENLASRIHRHQFPSRFIESRILSHQRREPCFLLRRRDSSFETGEQFADCDARGRDLGTDFFAGWEGGHLRFGRWWR